MPLKPGKDNIGFNIREMRAAGRPQDQAVAAAMRMARKSYALGGATDMVDSDAPLQPTNSPPPDYSMINPPQPQEPQAPPVQMAKFMSRPSAPVAPPRPAPRPSMPNEVSPWSRPPETMMDVNPEPSLSLPPTSPNAPPKEPGMLSKAVSHPIAAPMVAVAALQYGGQALEAVNNTVSEYISQTSTAIKDMVGRAMNPNYDYHKELSSMWKKRFAAEKAAKEHVNAGSQAYREGHLPLTPTDKLAMLIARRLRAENPEYDKRMVQWGKNKKAMEGLDPDTEEASPTVTPSAPDPGIDEATQLMMQKYGLSQGTPQPPKFAGGGDVKPPWYTISESRNLMRQGALHSPVPGRTDALPVTAKKGAYVVPADVVSGLGQGNTMAGTKTLEAMFKTGPYGTTMPKMRRPALPTGNRRNRGFAEGGEVMMGEEPGVDIMAAGGEFIIPPESVAEIGGGDIQHGHDILDAFVQKVRGDTIATMQQLPGPK